MIDDPPRAPVFVSGRVLGVSISAAAHLLLLVLLVVLWTTRPILLPPPKPIDVLVLSEQDYARSTAPPEVPAPVPSQAAPLQAPQAAVPTTPEDTRLPPTARPTPPTAPPLTHATRLFATTLLREPASREVRLTLPTLDRYERITQLCNIESTEQIRRAVKGSNPDTVSASAFSDTYLAALTMTAKGAAFRSGRNWYALSFVCTVLPDLSGVADYSFEAGAAIPKDQWEAHNLNAADEDDE